jgi:hypothetical protein
MSGRKILQLAGTAGHAKHSELAGASPAHRDTCACLTADGIWSPPLTHFFSSSSLSFFSSKTTASEALLLFYSRSLLGGLPTIGNLISPSIVFFAWSRESRTALTTSFTQIPPLFALTQQLRSLVEIPESLNQDGYPKVFQMDFREVSSYFPAHFRQSHSRV